MRPAPTQHSQEDFRDRRINETGGGILELSGTNTYRSHERDGGKLMTTNTGSLSGVTDISVASGAT